MFARGTAIVMAAAICAGGYVSMTEPSIGESAAATSAKITDRHPAYAGKPEAASLTLRVVKSDDRVPQTVAASTKGDLGTIAECGEQTWPQIASTCLEAADGAVIRPTVRTVSVTSDFATATSVALRSDGTLTAAR